MELSPSWTEDSVITTLPADVQDLLHHWHQQGSTPMGRLATPADVGNVVALLCTSDADFITGQIIHVDGGESLMNPRSTTRTPTGELSAQPSVRPHPTDPADAMSDRQAIALNCPRRLTVGHVPGRTDKVWRLECTTPDSGPPSSGERGPHG